MVSHLTGAGLRIVGQVGGAGRWRPGDAAIALLIAMYAIIASGGKQEKVAEGQQVRVELLDADEGSDVSLRPVMVVDGDTILSTPDELSNATVTGTIVGRAAGPKINGFTYKAKTTNRRRYGHRQKYHMVEITSISTS